MREHSPFTESLLATAAGADLSLTDQVLADRVVAQRIAVPWLWHRLVSGGMTRHPVLAERARHLAAADALAAGRLSSALAHLRNGGVSALVFKGAALSTTCYPEPWLRPRTDDDILVAPDTFAQAGRLLEACGYVAQPQNPGPDESGQAHFTQHFVVGDRHHIDLHWRPCVPRAFARLPSFAALHASRVPLPTLGPDAFAPAPVAHLLLLCAHHVAHHGAGDDAMWLLDVHLVAGRFERADWDALVRLAGESGVSVVCGVELARAAAAFGTRVPADVLEALEAVTGEPTARHLDAPAPLHRLSRDLVDDPHRAVRTLLTRLAPPPSYMRQRYGVPTLALPAAYLWRAVGGGSRWLIEALHRSRGR